MIELIITKTGKEYGKSKDYRIFDNDRKVFVSLKDAKQWLKENYGNCKKQKMFIDLKSGETKQSGYIYSFHNSDLSHSPVEKWLQQDWVEIREVNYKYPEL